MNTNKNNIEKIIIMLPTHSKKIEEVERIEIEVQDTQSTTKNSLVIVTGKTNRQQKRIDFKQIMQSFLYACQWSQFKRQLTKRRLLVIARRNKKRLAISLGICLICFSFAIKKQPSADQKYLSVTANILRTVSNNNSLAPLIVSMEAQNNYIARFSGVAQAEMKKFNIPASIILALAIANSNYGTNPLAQTGHNHFNIKCSNNHLSAGVVGQQQIENICYSQYENAWTSFRANSLLLTSESLAELQKVAQKDYQIWTSGLEKMNYPNAEKLNTIITKYNLAAFDEI